MPRTARRVRRVAAVAGRRAGLGGGRRGRPARPDRHRRRVHEADKARVLDANREPRAAELRLDVVVVERAEPAVLLRVRDRPFRVVHLGGMHVGRFFARKFNGQDVRHVVALTWRYAVATYDAAGVEPRL